MNHCLQCGDPTRNGPYCVACEYTQEAEPSDGLSAIERFRASCERAEQANERALKFLVDKQRKDAA